MKIKSIILVIALHILSYNSHAIEIVSNISETTISFFSIGQNDGDTLGDVTEAQGFTTGNNAQGYIFNNTVLDIDNAVGSPSNFEVKLYNASGSDPGSVIDTLSGDNNPATVGEYTYTPGSSINLSANTTYFIAAFAQGAAGDNYYKLNVTISASQTSSDGWTIADLDNFSDNNGTTWMQIPPAPNVFQFSIDATAVPEPADYTVIFGGMALAGVLYRRSYLKK